MKILDINEVLDGSKTIAFKEVLDTNGKWAASTVKEPINEVLQLQYGSECYDYFITQDDTGEHYIYRNPK